MQGSSWTGKTGLEKSVARGVKATKIVILVMAFTFLALFIVILATSK